MKYVFAIISIFIISAHAMADSGAPGAELRLLVDGMIEIDLVGGVHDYMIETELAPTIRHYIDKRVREWRFEPITVDGRPVIAGTRMRMALLATPDDGQYRLRVDDVHFGIAKAQAATNRAPRYPEDALRARLGARVLLALRTDATGRVTDVHPYQTGLTQLRVRGRSPAGWRRLFEKAATEAATGWTYAPDEYINGEPVAGTRVVSLVFRITEDQGGPLASGWQAYIPGPVTRAPWQLEDAQDTERWTLLQDSEAFTDSSRFQLIEKVVGALL